MSAPRRPAPSGRFVLRLSPPLHASLQAAARASRVSLNEYCVRRLAAPGSGLVGIKDASAIVERAAAVADAALVGVAVYGSWIRGDTTSGSDVDILVVVDRSMALDRSLYRVWDEAPVTWQGRPVDPHFVHRPDTGLAGGVWGEVAVDGVVLFERDLVVSTDLIRIRRDIAAGRLVRRTAHGQPYWTTAA